MFQDLLHRQSHAANFDVGHAELLEHLADLLRHVEPFWVMVGKVQNHYIHAFALNSLEAVCGFFERTD